MKKTIALFLATALFGVNAIAASNSNEHAGVTKKASSSIEIGYSPGLSNKEDLFFWSKKFVPFSNQLSSRVGTEVTLVPEPNVNVLKNIIKAQRYRWVYVNADAAVLAQEIAYTPVVKQINDVETVLVVRPASSFKKITDFEAKRFGVLHDDVTATFTRFKLADTRTKADVTEVTQGPEALLQLLDLNRVDVVALRREIAVEAAKKYPTRYRVLDSIGASPGFILLAHASVPQDEVDRVRSAFLSLRANDDTTRRVMVQYGDFSKEGPYFTEWDKDYLKVARKALAIVEPDYGRYVFDPAQGKYMEAHELASGAGRRK